MEEGGERAEGWGRGFISFSDVFSFFVFVLLGMGLDIKINNSLIWFRLKNDVDNDYELG